MGVRALRSTSLLMLAAALAACDVPDPAQRSAPGSRPGSDARSTETPSRPGSGGGLASIGEEEGARRVYYQFVDARGAVQFVPTLDAVPPEWRSRVGFVEMSSPPPLSPADAQRIRDARMRRGGSRTVSVPASVDEDEDTSHGAQADIVIYSADWCGACRAAKSYMDRKRIAYDERNVDEPRWREEMEAKAGRGGIPVFDVGGQILRGFSPPMLDEAIRSAS